KPLPYLLAQMNLLLHGLESPRINPENSLNVRLAEIGDKDRVDIILTNPPFGGEEERGILGNFAEDKQTAETALLFLQLIMRKLRRRPAPGRAGVVVPNGTLFGDGVWGKQRGRIYFLDSSPLVGGVGRAKGAWHLAGGMGLACTEAGRLRPQPASIHAHMLDHACGLCHNAIFPRPGDTSKRRPAAGWAGRPFAWGSIYTWR